MTTVKISQLPPVASPLNGTELNPVVQNGVTRKAATNQLGFLQGGTGASARTMQSKMRDFVDVKDFGAVGIANGGLDDTTAIQNAIDYAASVGKGIILGGAYRVNFLTIKNGLSFFSSGTLVKTGLVSSSGLLVVNSDVRYCEIYDLEMDLGGIINRGIFCNGAQFCTFDNNRIYNFTTPYNPAIPAEGIRLAQNSKYIYVSNNYIAMPVDTAGSYPIAIGIYITSNCSTPLGNFENGSFIQPTNLAEKCKIFGNTILNGAYGISSFGGMENEIYDNYMDGQSTRGIHLVPTSSRNFIHGNKIYNFGSTAIITAYGCNSNVISNNYCYAPNSNGEGGIVVYVGASGTVVNSNFIFCGSQYGVYTAVNVNNVIISDNTIVAAFNTEAAIAVESDWVSPLPAGADFSKPAYVPPPSPRTNWASDNTAYVTIKNNVINEPKSTIAGVYVAQIGSVADCVGIRNENNTITTTAPLYHVYYFQDGAGGKVLSQQVLSDLRTSDQSVSKVYLAGNRNKFAICSGNSIVNDAAINLAAGTTTPDVSVGLVFQHNDTSPTSVTNYVNGVDGQQIQVRLSSNTTIVYDVNKIRTKGSVNVVGTSTNEFMSFRNSGGVWIELWRSF